MSGTTISVPEASTGLAPQQVVEAFLANIHDLDRAFEYVHDDIVYENIATIPLPTMRGKRNALRFLRWGLSICSGFEIEIHHIAANGSTVLTERTDTFLFGDIRGSFWVCGTFEVRDGRIVGWRDYFDNGNFITGLARGALRAGAKKLLRR